MEDMSNHFELLLIVAVISTTIIGVLYMIRSTL